MSHNLSQYLLHNQFPTIKVFGLTLLQEMPLIAKLIKGSVQIIHNSRRHHWLMTSTINCYWGEVNIDDSVYIIPYLVVCRIVKNFFTPPEILLYNDQNAEVEKSCWWWRFCNCQLNLSWLWHWPCKLCFWPRLDGQHLF